MAAERGTQAHNHAEYILKTAKKLAANAANKRGAYREGSDGLERCPSKITAWALQKAIQGAPRPAWSASGFARGLRHWIEANVTAIHAVEFSIYHPAGFAGTCDGLLDIQGTLCVCDWKTTKKSIHSEMDAVLEGYKAQAGAYSLGLTHLTGIVAPSAAIVVARRTGAPSVTMLGNAELRLAEEAFLERVERYFKAASASETQR
jgi:ATP-dependent exoDNAse (exonuclease V) beta subunit